MNSSALLAQILCDPLAYIHPERFRLPVMFQGSKARLLINDLLISKYALERCCPSISSGSIAQALLAQWPRLPQVAFLMACQRHRAILARQGLLLRLPLWIQQFAKLDIVAALPSKIAVTVNLQQLLLHGRHELCHIATECPLAIRQRIPLLFPTSTDTAVKTADAKNADAKNTDVNLTLV